MQSQLITQARIPGAHIQLCEDCKYPLLQSLCSSCNSLKKYTPFVHTDTDNGYKSLNGTAGKCENGEMVEEKCEDDQQSCETFSLSILV